MKWTSVVYALFALMGFATAAFFGLPYWSSPGASLSGFRALAFANGPAATLGVDIALVYLLTNVWMVVEGRRLKMPRLWVYLLANTLVAVAFGLPLFLFFRERAISRQET